MPKDELEKWFENHGGARPQPGLASSRRWIDIRGYDRRVMQYLAIVYDLHQETIDDVATLQRDKVEVLGARTDSQHVQILSGMYSIEHSPFTTKEKPNDDVRIVRQLVAGKTLTRHPARLSSEPLQILVLGDNTLITVTQ